MFSRQQAYYQQEEPRLGNQYLEDSSLVALFRRLVPADALAKFEQDLIRFGDRVSPSGDILYHGRDAEHNPPKLISFNAFGRYAEHLSPSTFLQVPLPAFLLRLSSTTPTITDHDMFFNR